MTAQTNTIRYEKKYIRVVEHDSSGATIRIWEPKSARDAIALLEKIQDRVERNHRGYKRIRLASVKRALTLAREHAVSAPSQNNLRPKLTVYKPKAGDRSKRRTRAILQ